MLLLVVALIFSIDVMAQQPLYIVNGVVTENIDSIPPEDIDTVDRLPADEETIARYGEKAANGVLVISLRYDQEARFEADSTFSDYISRHVTWGNDEPAARVILRYRINEEGKAEVISELESTDSRLKRRVMKAVEEAPRWTPAYKNGKPIPSEGVLHVQLPVGKYMPRPVELVFR